MALLRVQHCSVMNTGNCKRKPCWMTGGRTKARGNNEGDDVTRRNLDDRFAHRGKWRRGLRSPANWKKRSQIKTDEKWFQFSETKNPISFRATVPDEVRNPTRTYAHSHTCAHARTHTHTQARTHTHAHTGTHTYAHIHKGAHTHTCARKRTHTHDTQRNIHTVALTHVVTYNI